MKFYIDTNIFLNIWKKERSPKTLAPWWRYGIDFIEKILKSQEDEGLYSGAILKELKFLLYEKDFLEKKNFLHNLERFRKVEVMDEDLKKARYLEKKHRRVLSFFDFLHIAICLKEGAILITRDRMLKEIAQRYIRVGRPEDFLDAV